MSALAGSLTVSLPMVRARPSPVPVKKGVQPWAIAALICAVAGTGLVVNGVMVMLTRTFGSSRLETVPSSIARDRVPTPVVVPSVSESTGDAGEATAPAAAGFQAPPAWMPIYADVLTPAHGTRREDHGAIKGITTFETADPLDKVKDFYKDKLTDEGFELTVDKSVTRLFEHAEITGKKDGGKMTVRAIMHRTKGQTTVNVNYTDSENAEGGLAEGSSAALPPDSPDRLPNSLPVWLPIYPSIKGEPRVDSSVGSTSSGTLEFESTDSVAKVRDFYFARLREGGYGVASGVGPGQGIEDALLVAKKDGGKFSVTIAIHASEGTTHVSIKFDGPS